MSTKGLKFIGRKKAVIDVHRHADIMEDAIDRIKVKEAMQTAEFVSWNEVEEKINKKLGLHAIHRSANKTGRKKSAKSK